MRRDHRPYRLKRLDLAFQCWYTYHFLAPQFDHLGEGCLFMKPWHVELFGRSISLGDHSSVIAAPDLKVRLTVWSDLQSEGSGIQIGRCALICPGVRICAATNVTIGDSCMLAHGVFITDADWHGIYDRSQAIGNTAPVSIGQNVWIGDRATICKGVHIGDNSIIAAGSVVVKEIPDNVIAGGNPAGILKPLDRNGPFRTRAAWLADPEALSRQFAYIDRLLLAKNTWHGWIRSLILPHRED